ncbi:MAG: DinB family protein [Dehalococcoidia bacterium]|nr:DinB family protein [Dehalococcoidia bacterium]
MAGDERALDYTVVAMGRAGVEQLLYLMDQAFEAREAHEWHSLLSNLESVRDEDWLRVPDGGVRSIAEIAEHVGEGKRMYANHAFGDAKMKWDDFGARLANLPAKAEMIGWLRQGQALWRGCVERLDDEGLTQPRMAHWGRQSETRWLIATMIEHDLYHAGEINYLRALAQGNDERY